MNDRRGGNEGDDGDNGGNVYVDHSGDGDDDHGGDEFETMHSVWSLFVGDIVVVTLQLDVLKRVDVEFVPTLPSWRERAIQSMWFGLLNKVFLRFEGVFWTFQIPRFK